MNADGTNPRRVTEMTGGAGTPIWMPGGKDILVPRGDVVLRLDPASGRTTSDFPGPMEQTLLHRRPVGSMDHVPERIAEA